MKGKVMRAKFVRTLILIVGVTLSVAQCLRPGR
jgi:hypothetical protein